MTIFDQHLLCVAICIGAAALLYFGQPRRK